MGVQKVVQRCEDCEENGGSMDLSDCQLMQVPDAVYYMMRNTTLVSCNLSSNVITKIPPKFPAKFSLITELYLSQFLHLNPSGCIFPSGTYNTKCKKKFHRGYR